MRQLHNFLTLLLKYPVTTTRYLPRVEPAMLWGEIMSNTMRRILRDCRGNALIEFAAVAGPFIALILASLETSLLFFSQQMLDTSGETMSRQIMTGEEQRTGTTKAAFKEKVCATLPDFMSCDRLLVNVEKVNSFSEASTAAPVITFDKNGKVTNPTKFDPGNPGDIVIMQVLYRWPSVTGPLGFGLGNLSNGERLLVSTAIFKTEKYE